MEVFVRILVVEDDFLVADAIRRGLSMAGFAVDCASAAEEAANALAAEHFDLLLLDIALPTYEPNGCPLCAQGFPVIKPGSRPVAT